MSAAPLDPVIGGNASFCDGGKDFLSARGGRISLTQGAYASGQAAHGQVIFAAKCAACHKDDLSASSTGSRAQR